MLVIEWLDCINDGRWGYKGGRIDGHILDAENFRLFHLLG